MRLAALLSLVLVSNPLAQSQWWLDEYDFSSLATGEGVVVSVIDTGIDSSHPDLQDVVIGGADFSGSGRPNGTAPVGPSGFHGTMVASLIAGQGRITGGVAGVAPGAKLLSVSIGLGLTDADTDRQIAQAVRWSVDNGAQIINLSISRNSVNWPASWDTAFLYAMERGVVIVAASGNESQTLKSATAPATMPGVISVTAVDQSNQTVAGVGSSGIGISLAAPGVDVLGSFPGGDVRRWTGSSAAAPLVTGLIALMLERDPSASATDIIQRLISTATDLGEPGFDGEYGWGLVSPSKALVATTKASTNPLGSLADWVRLYRPQTLEDTADLLVPQEVGPIETENDGNLVSNSGELLGNPLLYLLLAPLALLLWFGFRNRLGRAGKKIRR